MPKVEVTEAVWNYLTPEKSAITYLGKVYTALPRVANEQDLFSYVPPGTQVGAVIYMFIDNQSETRIALGGPHDGRKFRPYQLTLLCIMKTVLQDEAAEQRAFDEFIDSLTAWIQADRNAGDPQVIFQWGEGGINGGIDIQFDYPIPRTMEGGVMIHQAIGRVAISEILNT